MNVIICDDVTTRGQIETQSIIYTNGFITDRILFLLQNGHYIVSDSVLDDPKFQSISILHTWASDPDNIAEYPIPDPDVPPDNTEFDDISISDDIEYAAGDFVNLGSIAKGTTLSECYMVKKPNNELFIVVIYRATGEIIVLDVQENTYTFVQVNAAYDKPWKPVYHEPTDSLIFIVATSPDVFEYSFVSKTITYTTEYNVTLTIGYGMQDRCLGTDNNIYIGSQGGARVFKFNPSTNAITSYQQVENNNDTLVNNVGADAGYIYCILRNNGNYRIAIVNQGTGVATFHKEYTDAYKLGQVLRYKDTSTQDHFWWMQLTNSDSQAEFILKIKDGVERSDLDLDELMTPTMGGSLSINNTISSWPANFGVEIDISQVEGVDSTPVFKWKYTGQSFNTLSFTEIEGADFTIQVFERMEDNNIIGAFRQYSPIFVWDTSLEVLDEVHGFNAVSSYCVSDVGNKCFIGGYVDGTYQWDRSQPFVFGTNPFRVNTVTANAFYHYYHAKSGDYLYIGQLITRNDSGSAISIYNTVTGVVTNASAGQITTLKNYNISHLFVINGGNKLVFIGNPNISSITEPRIFVWDISSDKNINNTSPVTLNPLIDQIGGGFGLPVSTDVFMCFIENVVYKVDLSGPTITYKNLPGFLIRNAKAQVLTDSGKILLIINPTANQHYLYEIDPILFTGKKKSSDLGINAKDRLLCYNGTNLYLLGGISSISQFESVNSKYYLEKLIL